MPTGRNSTSKLVDAELAHNKAWQRVASFIVAAIGGTFIVGNDSIERLRTATWAVPWFLIIMTVSAFCIGRVYVGLITAERQMSEAKLTGDLTDGKVKNELKAFPGNAEKYYWISLGGLLGGLVFFIVVLFVAPAPPLAP